VKIAPAVSTKRIKRRIFQLAEQTNDWGQAGMTGKVAHDHASKLIAAFKLPQPLVIHVPFSDEEDAPRPPVQQAKPKGGKPGGKKQTPKEYILTIEYIQDLETQSLLKYVSISSSYITRLRKASSELSSSDYCTLRRLLRRVACFAHGAII
jgi:eukaryotic translation initiation factor 2C